ncbi:MAG TPA: tRNA pseudouridine(55) synthase TruB [Jatrophihabitans sp.]|nr:tRNA pseudouridine(55) synthase TruB [Jatrophihabitans sp.]
MARTPPAGPGGLIVVDKPAGMTSHDVVGRIRRLAGTRRVGHAGTLDPMATGVLVVGVERATKLLAHLVLTDKSYSATIRLGQRTSTDDAEGDVVEEPVQSDTRAAGLSRAQVLAGMATLTGAIEQRPAAVSAIKIDGRRAYERVRAGEDVQLAARPVTVARFELLGEPRPVQEWLDLDVEVDCSSGTYVRALARDLGEGLGVGGHLIRLRRTRVGPFRIEQARTLEQLGELAEQGSAVTLPLPAAIAAAMPIRKLTAQEARELSFGRAIGTAGLPGTYGGIGPEGQAIALLSETAGQARPVLGFTPAG